MSSRNILPNQHQCTSALLDWTDVPPTETSIVSNRITVHETFSQLPRYAGSGSLDFFIEPSNVENMCLFQSFLNLHLKVVKMVNGKEEELSVDDEVSYSPLIAHSLFKSINISINDEEVVGNLSSYYPYEAYVNTLIHLSRDEQRQFLETAAPHFSVPGTQLFTDPDFLERGKLINPGLTERHYLAMSSFVSEFTTPLLQSLFLVPKLLPTGVELKVSFTLNSPEFCLILHKEVEKDGDDVTPDNGEEGKEEKKKKLVVKRLKKSVVSRPKQKPSTATLAKARPKRAAEQAEGDVKYTIKIEAAQLNIQRYRVTPTQLLLQEQILQSPSGALYPMTTNKTMSFAVERGSTQVSKPLLISGPLPSMAYVFMVDRDSINNYYASPYRFGHQNYSQMWMESDGMKHPSGIGYAPQFLAEITSKDYYLAKSQLNFSNKNSMIDKEAWESGYHIIPFNLMPTRSLGCDYLSRSENKNGSITLHIRWSFELPEPIMVFVMFEYPRILSIDADRKPTWLSE